MTGFVDANVVVYAHRPRGHTAKAPDGLTEHAGLAQWRAGRWKTLRGHTRVRSRLACPGDALRYCGVTPPACNTRVRNNAICHRSTLDSGSNVVGLVPLAIPASASWLIAL